MQTLLGLLCLSVLLSTVFSLQCEKCALAVSCNAKNETCPDTADGCFTLQLDVKGTVQTTKDCMPKSKCEDLKKEKGKVIPKDTYGNYPDGAVVKEVECSKAYGTPASILLVISGLLAMRFLS